MRPGGRRPLVGRAGPRRGHARGNSKSTSWLPECQRVLGVDEFAFRGRLSMLVRHDAYNAPTAACLTELSGPRALQAVDQTKRDWHSRSGQERPNRGVFIYPPEWRQFPCLLLFVSARMWCSSVSVVDKWYDIIIIACPSVPVLDVIPSRPAGCFGAMHAESDRIRHAEPDRIRHQALAVADGFLQAQCGAHFVALPCAREGRGVTQTIDSHSPRYYSLV